MKRIFLFLFLIVAFATVSPDAVAQDGPPPDQIEDDEPERRPNLLRELGLSPEQVQQVRRINQERRPKMVEARRKLGDASRNLDMAIYGDAVSDAEFQTRLKEFHAAEAELSRLRFESELAIRKLLNPEQLVRFREMRRRFAEARRNNNNRRRMQMRNRDLPPMQDGPNRRPLN